MRSGGVPEVRSLGRSLAKSSVTPALSERRQTDLSDVSEGETKYWLRGYRIISSTTTHYAQLERRDRHRSIKAPVRESSRCNSRGGVPGRGRIRAGAIDAKAAVIFRDGQNIRS